LALASAQPLFRGGRLGTAHRAPRRPINQRGIEIVLALECGSIWLLVVFAGSGRRFDNRRVTPHLVQIELGRLDSGAATGSAFGSAAGFASAVCGLASTAVAFTSADGAGTDATGMSSVLLSAGRLVGRRSDIRTTIAFHGKYAGRDFLVDQSPAAFPH
jgi:hypothetical protein